MKTWITRIAIGLLSLVVLVIIAGTAYEAVARAQAVTEFPAPGRLVAIGGGRHIQLDCRGAGVPVVVFESGLDSLGSLSWAAVHDAIAQTTRACAYSRAGIMWSDPSDRPFSAANVAEDLHHALTASGEQGPYIMVGHSLGGPYLLTYTGRYGGEVAGLVFVDASHPDQIARMRAAVGKDLAQPTTLVRVAASLVWTGLVRVALWNAPPTPPNASAAINGSSAAWFATSLRSMAQELEGLAATLTIAVEARQLGDRPLVVLTRGEKSPPDDLEEMQLTNEQGDCLDVLWGALQADEATWSTRSRHETVPHASHYIQFDQPQAVIAAVHDVIDQVRQASPK